MIAKIKDLRKNKSLMNGAMFSLFSFVNRGFSFLLLLILANYILPSEYGFLNLYSTVVMVIGFFTAMSTEGYFSVAYFKENNGLQNTFSGIFYVSITTSIILSITIFWGGDQIAKLLNLPFNILILTVPICFLTVYTNINLDYLRLKGDVKKYGLLSCGNALLNFVVSITLVKYCFLGWEGRVYAQTLCLLFFGIIGLGFFLSHGYLKRPNWQYIKNMLIWGLPLIPHLATNFIRQGCDRYIINAYHSIEDVGLFSFALNLVNIITMVGFGFNQSNSVDIYKTLGDNEINIETKLSILSKNRQRFTKLYILSSLMITLTCYLIVPYALPRYESAMNYFVLLAIYGFLVCMYLIYTNYLFFFKKTKSIMIITLSSSLLHLCLSLLLTKYSLYYTALLYCVTQLLVVVLIRWKGKKEITKI